MGIVRTQSLVGSAWVYLGAALGFVTSALLFPNYLEADQIGMLNLLVTYREQPKRTPYDIHRPAGHPEKIRQQHGNGIGL